MEEESKHSGIFKFFWILSDCDDFGGVHQFDTDMEVILMHKFLLIEYQFLLIEYQFLLMIEIQGIMIEAEEERTTNEGWTAAQLNRKVVL